MVIQGVIRPPPEIRAVADRTALYVSKNGRGFELRIVNSEKGKTPKFAFLQPNSPFHAYYEDRISFYENGGKDGDENENNQESNDNEKKVLETKSNEDNKATESQLEKKGKLSACDPVARAILSQRSRIAEIRSSAGEANKESESREDTNDPGMVVVPPPPPLYFANIIAPSSLSMAQIETIQLVAQMTALDGRGGGFLQSLVLREWNNPEFAFCQPRHGHFAYFSALVDAYRRILSLWTGDSKSPVPDDYTPQLAKNVEKCLEMAAYRCEYERDQAEYRRNGQQGTLAPSHIDWNDFVVVETIDFPVDEKVLTLAPPPPPPSTKNLGHAAASKLASRTDDAMEDDSDEDGEPIRVVPSYTPKVVSAQSSSVDMVIDPITGKSVPVKDMPEHMRIQLLDPKWAEERKKFQDKQKESNLVGGDVIASNLARFAQARGISNEDALSREESKKRLEDANRVLREQALDSSTPMGPSLPGIPTRQQPIVKPNHPPPSFDGFAQQPDAKKARLDMPPPPPPPPPPPSMIPTTLVKPPPPESLPKSAPGEVDPFAAALDDAPFGASGNSSEPLSEAAFVASLARPEVTLQIRIPNDPVQMAWNFYGQIVSLTVNVMTNVKEAKQELSRIHLNNMPVNKIQLKSSDKGVFLKDNLTLAALNIGPTATLDLVPKTRGGRK